jgi:phage tail-like protein
VSAASSKTVQKWLASNRDKTEETSMKITVFDAWVQEVINWTFRHVVVLSWKAGGLDAKTQGVATEELELRHEGFL